MIRMTPELQKALGDWKDALLEYRDGDISGAAVRMTAAESALEFAYAAYRAVPQAMGKWTAGAVLPGGTWWVEDGDQHYIGRLDQRTAEAYRDALNCADAALTEDK